MQQGVLLLFLLLAAGAWGSGETCSDPILLELGDEVVGSTDPLGSASSLRPCFDFESPGAWFAISGGGHLITIDSCGSSFDTVFALYESCEQESCSSLNDDACGLQSEVSFCAVEGTEYRLFLGGYQGSTGQYLIKVSNEEVDCGIAETLCEYLREPMQPNSVVVADTSTFTLFPPESLSCGGAVFTSGSFHLHPLLLPPLNDGRRPLMHLSTCGSEDFRDTLLALYQYSDEDGNCGAFECVGSNDDTSFCTTEFGISPGADASSSIPTRYDDYFESSVNEVNSFASPLWSSMYFCGNADAQYAVQVAGYQDNTGEYNLQYSHVGQCYEGIESNACEEASRILDEEDVAIASGSTLNTVEGIGQSWFEVVGDGSVVVVDACDSQFRTRVAVYDECGAAEPLLVSMDEGLSCDWSFHCVECALKFCALPGRTYQVRVYGDSAQRGDFQVLFRRFGDSPCTFPPEAPRHRLTDLTSTSASLEWRDWSDNFLVTEQFHVVLYDAERLSELSRFSTPQTEFVITGLSPGSEYAAEVIAENEYGLSENNHLLYFSTFQSGACVFESAGLAPNGVLQIETSSAQTSALRGIRVRTSSPSRLVMATMPAIVKSAGELELRVYESSAVRKPYFRIRYTAVVEVRAASFAQEITVPLDVEMCPQKSYLIVVDSSDVLLFRDPFSNSSLCTEQVTLLNGVEFGGFSWALYPEQVFFQNESSSTVVAMRLETEAVDGSPRISPPEVLRVLPFPRSVQIEWGHSPCYQDAEDPLSLYNLEWHANGVLEGNMMISAQDVPYTLTGLASTTTYELRITAMTMSGVTSEPSVVEFTTTGNAPVSVWYHHTTLPSSVFYGIVRVNDVDGRDVQSGAAVFSCGYFSHGVMLAGTHEGFSTSVPYSYDSYFAAFDKSSALIYAIHAGRTLGDVVFEHVVVDSDESRDAVYVTGYFTSSFEIGQQEFVSPFYEEWSQSDASFNYNILTMKFAASTGAVEWYAAASNVNGTGLCTGKVSAVDSAGDVFVGATFALTNVGDCLQFAGSDECIRHRAASSYSSNSVVVKYSGESGAVVWATGLGSDGYNTISALDVTTDGDIIVSGHAAGSVMVDDAELHVAEDGVARWYVVRLSGSDGSLVWEQTAKWHVEDEAQSRRSLPLLAVHGGMLTISGHLPCHSVTFAGQSLAEDCPDNIEEVGASDIFLVAGLDAGDGAVAWTYIVGANSLGEGVLFYGTDMEYWNNDIVIVGAYFGAFPLFGLPDSTEGANGAIVGFSGDDGTPLWARYIESTTNDVLAKGVATTGDSFVVVGDFTGITSFSCDHSIVADSVQSWMMYLSPVEAAVPLSTSAPSSVDCQSLAEALSNPLSDLNGVIEFPGDDAAYASGLDCWWFIAPSEVSIWRVALEFDAFRLGDGADYLEIFDGDVPEDSGLLRYWTGDSAFKSPSSSFVDAYDVYRTDVTYSSQTSVLMHFHSSECIPGPGFALTWLSSDRGAHCINDFPTTLLRLSGTISEVPVEGYKPNANCQWLISPAFAQVEVIVVTMEEWDVEGKDYVVFYDGPSTADPVIARVSGFDARGIFQSTGPEMLVQFVSDNAGFGSGFVFTYEAYDDPLYCLNGVTTELRASDQVVYNVTSDSAVELPHLPSSECLWDVVNDDPARFDSVYIAAVDMNLSARNPVVVEYQPSVEPQDLFVEGLTDVPTLLVSYGEVSTINFTSSSVREYSERGFNVSICFHEGDHCCEPVFLTEHSGRVHNHFCGPYYEADANCEWTIEPSGVAGDHSSVLLVFEQLDFRNGAPQQPDDFLTVFREDGSVAHVLSASGNDLADPPVLSISGASVKLQFVSDASLQGEGFDLHYCVSDGHCADEQHEGEGQFGNEFCSGRYAPNSSCKWIFDGGAGAVFFFQIDSLEFPQSQINTFSGRAPDHLSLFVDGNRQGLWDHDGFTAFTGDELEYSKERFSFAISGPTEVMLEFQSDDVDFGRAFNASYCVLPLNDPRLCSGVTQVTDPEASFNNSVCLGSYQPNSDCVWEVDVTGAMGSDDTAVLFVSSLDLGAGDAMSVSSTGLALHFEGPDSLSSVVAEEIASGKATVHFTSDAVVEGEGFVAEVCVQKRPIAQCGGDEVIDDLHGVIRDRPCGPVHSAPLDCQWSIRPSSSLISPPYYIILEIQSLGLHARTSLVVRNESSIFAEASDDFRLSFFANQLSEGDTIVVEADELDIYLDADVDVVLGSGIEIWYTVSPESGRCTDHELNHFTESSGKISDHTFGKFYENNMDCTFLIEVEAGPISVRFESFRLEEGYDFLEVYDGSSESAPLLGYLTGIENPGVIVSSASSLFLVFRTDFSVVEEGFVLEYAVDPPCPFFCSGHGVCSAHTGECSCNVGFQGDGCEIFPPPFIRYAQFANSAAAVHVKYSRPTNRAGMYRSLLEEQFLNCSRVLEERSLAIIGERALCTWLDDSTLEVVFGGGATIMIGDTLNFVGGVLQQRDGDDAHPIAPAQDVITLAPEVLVTPRAVIVGPQVFNPPGHVDELFLDSWGTEYGGGRVFTYRWDVFVVESCDGDRSEAALVECDAAHRVLSSSPAYNALREFVTGVTTAGLTVPAEHLNFPGHAYVFMVSASNYLGRTDSSEFVAFQAEQPRPAVTIDGPVRRKASASDILYVRASVELPLALVPEDRCPRLTYSWLVAKDGEDEYVDVGTSSGWALYLDPGVLSPSTSYRFVVEVALSDSPTTPPSSAVTFIETLPLHVEAAVLEGNRWFSRFEPIVLNVEVVNEQHFSEVEGEFHYNWLCTRDDTEVCSRAHHDAIISTDSPRLELPAGSLLPGLFYKFSCVVSHSAGAVLDGDVSVLVLIAREQDIPVSIVPLSQDVVNVDDVVSLRAVVDNDALEVRRYSNALTVSAKRSFRPAPVDTTKYEWSVIEGDIDLHNENRLLSKSITRPSLVLAKGALVQGSTYRFRLDVSRADGSSGAAEIQFEVNDVPVARKLDVEPQSAPFTAQFAVRLREPSDSPEDYPLAFQFSYRYVTCPQEVMMIPTPGANPACPELPLSTITVHHAARVFLPPGELILVAHLHDRHHGQFRLESDVVTVTEDEACSSVAAVVEEADKLLDEVRSLLCAADLDHVRQLCDVVSSLLACSVPVVESVERMSTYDEDVQRIRSELSEIIAEVDEQTERNAFALELQVSTWLMQSIVPEQTSGSVRGRIRSSMVDYAYTASLAGAGGFVRNTPTMWLQTLVNGFPAAEDANNEEFVRMFEASSERSFVGAVSNVAGALLLGLDCDELKPSDVQSSMVAFQSNTGLGRELQGSQVTTARGDSMFELPDTTALPDGCYHYVAIDVDGGLPAAPEEAIELHPDEQSQLLAQLGRFGSGISTLSLYSSEGELPFDTSEQGDEIRIILSRKDENMLEDHASVCSFFDVSTSSWSTVGCRTGRVTSDTVECLCTHLTSFAVLVGGSTESSAPEPDMWLVILSSVSVGVACLCVCAAVIVTHGRRQRQLLKGEKGLLEIAGVRKAKGLSARSAMKLLNDEQAEIVPTV